MFQLRPLSCSKIWTMDWSMNRWMQGRLYMVRHCPFSWWLNWTGKYDHQIGSFPTQILENYPGKNACCSRVQKLPNASIFKVKLGWAGEAAELWKWPTRTTLFEVVWIGNSPTVEPCHQHWLIILCVSKIIQLSIHSFGNEWNDTWRFAIMENLPTSSSKTPREVACNSTGHALENRLSDLEPQSHLLGAMWYVMFFVAQVVFLVKMLPSMGLKLIFTLTHCLCRNYPETFIATMSLKHSLLPWNDLLTLWLLTPFWHWLKKRPCSRWQRPPHTWKQPRL